METSCVENRNGSERIGDVMWRLAELTLALNVWRDGKEITQRLKVSETLCEELVVAVTAEKTVDEKASLSL